MSRFEDAIQDFRDQEQHEAALQLLLDKTLLKYASLWRPTVVKVQSSYPLGDDWNDLWDCVEVDFKRLADLADEGEGRTRFQVNRLRELRLIYPDGSRTEMATKAIFKFMKEALT